MSLTPERKQQIRDQYLSKRDGPPMLTPLDMGMARPNLMAEVPGVDEDDYQARNMGIKELNEAEIERAAQAQQGIAYHYVLERGSNEAVENGRLNREGIAMLSPAMIEQLRTHLSGMDEQQRADYSQLDEILQVVVEDQRSQQALPDANYLQASEREDRPRDMDGPQLQ